MTEEDPPRKQNAVIIEEQCQRMERIVRQLLDFARARKPAKATTDIARLARDTSEMLASLAQKRGATIAVDAPAQALATVDSGQVQQAITNLVVNALHASKPGQEVRLVVVAEGPTLAVVDEGAGMDEDTMAKLFTPFFTTKDVGEGTGLGLAVAWGLVQENGGHITVTSEKGKGSVFTIHFNANGTSAHDARAA